MNKCTCSKCKDATKNGAPQGGSFVNGAVFGTLVGLGLAALLFPPQGKENRKKLKDTTEKTLDKSKEIINTINDYVEPKVEIVKPIVSDIEQEMIKTLKTNETVQSKVTHLAEFSLDSIQNRMKKHNKNATKRKYFRGNF